MSNVKITARPILMSAPMVRAILAGTKTQTRRTMRKQFCHDAEPEEMCATNEAGHQASGHSGLWWDAVRGDPGAAARCPYGKPGDRLWVREAFSHFERNDQLKPGSKIFYRADGECVELEPWRPSIHMPRFASRITLAITEVRVERLQEIGEADAIAEGLAELVPHLKRSEGLTPTALAFAAAATVAEMPRASRRAFLGGALAAALGFTASPSRQWEVLAARMARAPSPQQLYALLWDSINGPGTWDANPWVWAIGFRRELA